MQPLNDVCDDGVKAHDGNQPVGGGSIPASSLHCWFGEIDEAKRLVMAYHYSRRWPSNVQSVTTVHESGGLYGNKGPAIGAAVFSIPGTRWSKPVWELSRLVRRDGQKIPLSFLVSKGVGRCRREGAHLIVSFADSTHGHYGGVYQACGWHYSGQRDSQMDGVVVSGVFVPGRSANSRWGTRSPDRLRAIGINAKPHYDTGKHLYWKALDATGVQWAKELGLSVHAYPKPKRDDAA